MFREYIFVKSGNDIKKIASLIYVSLHYFGPSC